MTKKLKLKEKATWLKRKKAEKVVEKEVKQEIEEVKKPEGPVCHCGEPLAPGQTSVCRGHIRTN